MGGIIGLFQRVKMEQIFSFNFQKMWIEDFLMLPIYWKVGSNGLIKVFVDGICVTSFALN